MNDRELSAVSLARECLYRFLAAPLRERHTAGWELVLDAQCQELARAAAELLRAESSGATPQLGLGELPLEQLTLAPLLAALEAPATELDAEFDRVFGLIGACESPPYETEFHSSKDTFFRSQEMADVAGFYRAFGLTPAARDHERPDHLALELEFMAFVLMKQRLALETAADSPDNRDQAELCEETLRAFFRDHLAWWTPAFTLGLRRKAEHGLYAALGQALAAFITSERIRFSLPPPRLPLQPELIERSDEQEGCMSCAAGAGAN